MWRREGGDRVKRWWQSRDRAGERRINAGGRGILCRVRVWELFGDLLSTMIEEVWGRGEDQRWEAVRRGSEGATDAAGGRWAVVKGGVRGGATEPEERKTRSLRGRGGRTEKNDGVACFHPVA
jgi:hypothetical protein